MIVYCLSGLGADERVFTALRLNATLRHVSWIKPKADESIQEYSKRLVGQIDASQPFALLGVSFGGLVAQFMAALLPQARVIIVSSGSAKSQLPASSQLPFLLPLVRRLPPGLLMPPRRLMAWLFGVERWREQMLFYQILKDTDPHFVRWALLAVLDMPEIPPVKGLVQLHGTADRVIPCPKTASVIRLEGAGHFMIYNRAGELSSKINKLLAAHA